METILRTAALLSLGLSLAAGDGARKFTIAGTAKIAECSYQSGWFDPNKPSLHEGPRPRPPPQPGETKPPEPPAPVEPSFRLLIRSGKVNTNSAPVLEVETRPGGAFSVQLPAGTWCAVFDDKRSLKRREASEPAMDAKCLRERHRTCDAIWTVTGDQADANVLRQQPCKWEDKCNPNRPNGPPAMD